MSSDHRNGLLFIRHAETNMSGRFCGRCDPPVNPAGHRQIKELVESLRNKKITAVYTSNLQRSVTTARALAESFAIPSIVRPALHEIDFGKWENLTWEEIEQLDSAFATQWLNAFPYLTPPDGESFEIFEARVMNEVNYLSSQSERSLIAVVTHAGVMRTVLRKLCNLDETTAWTQTRSYCCTFRYTPQDHMQEVLS